MVFFELISIVTALGSIAIIGQLAWQLARRSNEQSHNAKGSAESKIRELTASLNSAAELMLEIEKEILSKGELVEKLRSDQARYDALLKLNKDDVEAISQVLTNEMKSDSRRSFWRSVAVNFLFLVLGAAISWWLTGTAG